MIAALDTEMRRGEMLKLRFADVDFSRGLITLPGGNTKRKKTRLVAFSTQRLCAVVKWLQIDAEGDQWTISSSRTKSVSPSAPSEPSG